MTLTIHRFGPTDGPAILCLHGVTGHGLRFRRVATECLAGRRVLAPDLRGHGRSHWTPPWRLEDHVADLLGLLDTEGVDRVSLIGHSFGGLITTHLLAAAPERFDRAVLLDPAIALDPADAQAAAEEARTPSSWASIDDAKVARREQRVQAGYAGSDADVDDHLVEGADGRWRFRFCAAATICAWAEMARPHADLRSTTTPVHLVTAAQAPYVRDSTREWLRGDLGTRFTETVIDASHMLYWDAYPETATAIMEGLGG